MFLFKNILSRFRFSNVKLILVTLLLSSSNFLFAFNQYSIDNGLSNNNVECIMQDSQGFLWFGTWNGLNKYDGYSFEKYYSNKTINGLSNNWITSLFEDSQGTIWAGSVSGLSYYEKESNTFKTYTDIKDHYISGIVEDFQHRIWISTSAGFFVIDGKTKNVVKTLLIEQNQLFLNPEEIIIDKKGFIWAGCKNGVIEINPNNYTVKKQIKLDWIKAIKFDSKGNIWCGSRTDGLFVIDTATSTKRIYKYDNNNASSIGSNSIWSIYIDKKQNIWIACQNGFLNKYDPKTDSFIKNHDLKLNMNSYEFKSITSTYEDFQGNLWIGSHRAGLYSIHRKSNVFEVYKSSIYANKKVQFTNVTSFAESSTNSILFSTDGDGIFVLNPEEKNIYQLPTNNKLLTSNIITLYRNKSTIWAATWGGGIAKISIDKNFDVTNYIYNKSDERSIPINNIKGLYLNDSMLWIGTHGEGLSFLNLKSQVFYHYKNPLKAYTFNYKDPQWINHITKTNDGTMWISSFYGVYTFAKGKLTHYINETNNPQSISNNSVYTVFQNSQNEILILTGNGINRFDPQKKVFENLSSKYNLPIYAKSFTEDSYGNLFISSEEGITIFSLKTHKSITYSNQYLGNDGEFTSNACYKSNDGSIYFGTTTGIIRCQPDKIKQKTGKINLVIRNVLINYNKVSDSIIAKADNQTKIDRLELSYSKDIVTLEIAAIQLSEINQISYSYKLDGYDDAWIKLHQNRFITFSGLSPGTYTLKVKALINNETSVIKSLEIVIHPKWWMTIWFKIILIIILIFILLLINYLRLYKQKKLNILLQEKIKERTKDLVLVNTELQQQKIILQEQYSIISSKNEELQIANNSKLKLFSIISHDLKNPLNAMLVLSQTLIDNFNNYSEEKKLQLLGNISTATKSITNLTLNLLNWSVIQTDTIKPSLESYDISTIIHEAILLELEIAKAKEIKIVTNYNHAYSALIDRTMISTVIRNIIQNSLKFTPIKGTIIIDTYDDSNYIHVKITDTGIGMPNNVIEAILKTNSVVSTYGTNNEKGTGLGLNIVKEFIYKNNGLFQIESQIDVGTTFISSFPKGQAIIEQLVYESEIYENEQNQIQHQSKVTKDNETIVCIVEDNENVLVMIENLFSDRFKTITAKNGKEALESILAHVPDIIITDIEMPEMSGIELITELRKHPVTNHIPVVILSSRNADYHQIVGYKAGADDYITKPFNQEILRNKVDAILEQRKRYLIHAKTKLNDIQKSEMPKSFDEIFLKKVLEYIELHYKDEEFSVEDIANNMSISRVQLYRKFKTILGVNPQDFIKNFRLEKAAILLKTNKFRVADVAFAVGFNESNYFSSCFIKHYGITPSKYMEMHS